MGTNATSRRTGWLGLLVPQQATITADAARQAGPHAGPAVPSSDNTGDLILRSLRIDRQVDLGVTEIRVSRPGAATSGGLPAEIMVTPELEQEAGWLDPSTSRHLAWEDTEHNHCRVTRYGGATGRSRVPRTVTSTGPVDACPNDATNGYLVLEVDVAEGYAALVVTASDADDDEVWTTTTVIPEDEIDLAVSNVESVRVALRGLIGVAALNLRLVDTGEAIRDHIVQYASDDGGRSWRYVGTSLDIEEVVACGDLTATTGGFLALYATQESNATVFCCTMTSATEPIWTARRDRVCGYGWNHAITSLVKAFDAAIDTDEAGVPFAMVLSYGSPSVTQYTYIQVLRLPGAVWESVPVGLRNAPLLTDDANRGTQIADATVALGGLVTLLRDTADDGLQLLMVGGWTSRGPTPLVRGGVARRGPRWTTFGWVWAWYRTCGLPGSAGWTTSGAAPSSSANGMITYTSNGYNERAIADPMCSPCKVLMRAQHIANAPVSSSDGPGFADVALFLDPAAVYVRVTWGEDGVRVYTLSSGGSLSQVGSEASHLFGDTQVAWLIHVSVTSTRGVTVRVVGCSAPDSVPWESSWLFDNTWTTTADDVSGTYTSSLVRWGSFSSGAVSSWRSFAISDAGQTAPLGDVDAVPGRPLAATVSAVPDLLLAPVSGAANADDTWTVATEFDGAVEHLTVRDPRLRWRSPSTASATLTAMLVEPVPGPLLGILLRNIVHEGLTVEIRNASTGSWSTLAVDETITGLSANRAGSTLTPRTGTTNAILARAAEFDGDGVVYDGVGLQIGRTLPGKWVTSGQAPAALQVPGLDDAGAAANGALVILPRTVGLVVHTNATVVDGVRVTLAAAAADWGDVTWSSSRLLVGPVLAIADEPDWGRAVRCEIPVQAQEDAAGRPHARRRLPPRREVEVAFTDGIDTSRANDDDDEPDWIGAWSGSTVPVAHVGATPWTIEGVARMVDGAAGELVVFHRVDMDALDGSSLSTAVFLRRHELLHGYLDTPVSIETMLGDENADEVVRVGRFVVREIV